MRDRKFIGITGDDVLKYDLKKHYIKLDEKDYSRIKQVSEYAWFKDNKGSGVQGTFPRQMGRAHKGRGNKKIP